MSQSIIKKNQTYEYCFKALGFTIKTYRKSYTYSPHEGIMKSGLTQKELAELVGTSEKTISRLEKGENINPSLELLCNFSYVFKINLSTLLDGCKYRIR